MKALLINNTNDDEIELEADTKEKLDQKVSLQRSYENWDKWNLTII